MRSQDPMPSTVLVSAVHREDADRVAARLSDGHRMHVDDDPVAAARTIAERAEAVARGCGRDVRHGLVVTLAPGSDTRAVGMLLANAARAETGDDRVLRHLVSVLRADDVAHLLWSEVDDAFVAAERIAALVEDATVIVLDRTAALPRARLASLVALLHRTAPRAVVMAAERLWHPSDLPASNGGAARVLASGAGWMRALSSDADDPRPDPDGLDTLRYREPFPFHPQRLAEVVEHDLAPGVNGRVLRSRGFFRLASRPDHVGSWSSFGGMLALDPTANRSWDADAPVGQAIWFVGEGLDVRGIETALDRALLTSEELLAGPGRWRSWADPFPVWPALEHED